MIPLPSLCMDKILWEIYNEVVIDDNPLNTLIDIRNTLFNCLLVNRDFCRHVVPILWRNTFNWYLPSSKLVASYLCFLSPEVRLNLSQRLNINNISNLLDSCSRKRPFFNYASFLRELEYHSVFKSVQELFSEEEQSIDCQLLMVEELFKMFLSQCPTLYRLDLATDINSKNHFKFTPIPSYTFAKSCLIKLKEFKCSDHLDQLQIFNNLSNICHNIEVMQLGVFHHNSTHHTDPSLYEAIHRLIISQRYLRKFIFSFAQKGFMSIIGSAFLAKSISLQDVTLHACDFLDDEKPFVSLVECYNLSSLTLIDCKNLQGTHFSPLTFPMKRRTNRTPLRLNIVYNDPLQCFDIKSIMTHTNVFLSKLLLNDIIQPCSFIEHISTHCPNLIHFRANISANVLPQIPLLFKSLKKLEIIELNDEKVWYENLVPVIISNELATEISKSIPNTLYSFTFLLLVVFTSQSLSLFLEQLDQRSIIMSDDEDYEEYYDEDYDEYDYDEYIDIEMSEVVFEKFSVRIDLEEYEHFKLFSEFECTRFLDDKNSRLVPTYVDMIFD